MDQKTLWSYDFTVITIGSFVSLVGSTLSNFALSLVVLDYTGSTFLYMLVMAAYQLPMLVCPVFAGPWLDRVSRRKVIYSLDFLSAGIYLLLFLLLHNGWFHYPVLLAVSVLTGSISSVYSVAYESFYPNLISEGNFSRAYAVDSLLYEVASMTAPLAAALYSWLGSAAILFAMDAASFFAAACFEVSIRCRETHMEKAAAAHTARASATQFQRDFQEGAAYIRGEKGLLLIALYFMMSSMAGSAEQLQLPYFLNHAQRFAAWPVDPATLYALLLNCYVIGRLLSGLVQYRIRIPAEKKFSVSLFAYVSLSALSGTVLFMPVPVMAVSFFVQGIVGVTSFTIRTAATQSYVPDEKRARFNGIFQMLTSVGAVAGSLMVGALGEVLPERLILAAANALVLGAVYLFIYRGGEHIKRVYNREV